MSEALWQPTATAMAASNMRRFMDLAEARHGLDLPDYRALYNWSVSDAEDFWSLLC